VISDTIGMLPAMGPRTKDYHGQEDNSGLFSER